MTLAVILLLAVIILSSVFVPDLIKSVEWGYLTNPWDDGFVLNAFTKSGDIFAYSTAIKAIEETQGMDFSQNPYTYLGVDLSGTEEELKEALEEYFTYWGKKNGKKVVFGTKEELKAQGLVADDGKNTFTDGYLLEFHDNEWTDDREMLVVNYYFHHADFDGNGYTVTVYKKWNGWQADDYIAALTS